MLIWTYFGLATFVFALELDQIWILWIQIRSLVLVRKERQDAHTHDQDFTSQLSAHQPPTNTTRAPTTITPYAPSAESKQVRLPLTVDPVFLMRRKQAECQHIRTGWRLKTLHFAWQDKK